MRFRFFLLLVLVLGAATLSGAERSRSGFELAGRSWLPWPQARVQAREQNKPLLVVQMLGDLDEEFC